MRRLFLVFMCLPMVIRAQPDSIRGFRDYRFSYAIGGTMGKHWVYDQTLDPNEFNKLGINCTSGKGHLLLQVGHAGGTLTDSVGVGDKWAKGKIVSSTFIEAGIGYTVSLGDRWRLVPMLNAGTVYYNPVPSESFYARRETPHYFNYSVNAVLDFSILQLKAEPVMGTQMFARALAGYYPNYYRKPFELQGGCFFATIGIYMGMGWLNR